MIEVNLLEQKKPMKMPVVLGVDLAKINYKKIIIAIVISYLPEYLYYPTMVDEVTAKNAEIESLKQELAKIQADIKGNEAVKNQLEAFNKQVERLKERSEQVEKIIKTRTNPRKIMERIARNMPEDMWLKTLEISKDKKMTMDGLSSSYKSIGNFIVLLNESSFFGKSVTLADSKTEEDAAQKTRRLEFFKIVGTVDSYDPFQ
jgi:Tfp pilus assembly protein PilN